MRSYFQFNLQMAPKDRNDRIKEGIEWLFKDSALITSSDTDFQAKLREIQMAYGILLKRSGLMNLTKIEDKIEDTKRELDNSSKVTRNIAHHCMSNQFNLTTSPHTSPCTMYSSTHWN